MPVKTLPFLAVGKIPLSLTRMEALSMLSMDGHISSASILGSFDKVRGHCPLHCLEAELLNTFLCHRSFKLCCQCNSLRYLLNNTHFYQFSLIIPLTTNKNKKRNIKCNTKVYLSLFLTRLNKICLNRTVRFEMNRDITFVAIRTKCKYSTTETQSPKWFKIIRELI